MIKLSTTVIAIFCVLFLSDQVIERGEGKLYTRCGLAEALLANGFQRTFIGQWICLIESESGKNTTRQINKADGSKALGLFQIKDKQWCTFGKKGGNCQMKCEDLLNDDISDDSACARRVESSLGFRAWEGWMRSCYRRNLPIPSC